MNLRISFYFALLLPVLSGSTAVPAAGTADAGLSLQSQKSPAHRIRLPQPPAGLDNAGKAEYLIGHYWDSFDFKDRTWIADTAAFEQAFADWAYVLLNIPREKAAPLAGWPIERAAVDEQMFARFLEVAGHYFDDPNSPYRSEELYIPVLEAAIAAPGIAESYKIGPREQLKRSLRNRPGTIAAEFVGTTASGGKVRLSQTGGDYTLLLFYTPDCPECGRAEQHIAGSKLFSPLIREGLLSMLAIYVDDDFAAWRRHLPELPAAWTVLCDPGQVINRKQTYVLRATPSLYLLDRDKRVLLKDAAVGQIETWLTEHIRTNEPKNE